MIKVSHIENAILGAKVEVSKLNSGVLEIEGFSSCKIRHFLNNLFEAENINYLEIGVFTGSTFISALYKNKVNSAYIIDNWSEFGEYCKGDVKTQFLNNAEKHGINNFTLLEEDCFKLDLSKIKDKINIYFYDGEHTEESQCNALKYYYPVLADTFIYLVDDFDYPHIRKGTRCGIVKMNLKVRYEKYLESNISNNVNGWWNGYFISILQK